MPPSLLPLPRSRCKHGVEKPLGRVKVGMTGNDSAHYRQVSFFFHPHPTTQYTATVMKSFLHRPHTAFDGFKITATTGTARITPMLWVYGYHYGYPSKDALCHDTPRTTPPRLHRTPHRRIGVAMNDPGDSRDIRDRLVRIETMLEAVIRRLDEQSTRHHHHPYPPTNSHAALTRSSTAGTSSQLAHYGPPPQLRSAQVPHSPPSSTGSPNSNPRKTTPCSTSTCPQPPTSHCWPQQSPHSSSDS